MDESATVVAASESELSAIAELAGRIWRACYPGIISSAQIEFMLGRMYSLDTLRDEMRSQEIRFYRLLRVHEFAGFASIGPTGIAGVMKLHKLYVLPEVHGRGLGSLLIRHCEIEARRLGAKRLILAVNKRNSRAIASYQRNGFATIESVKTDIGGGFVMDDYIMSKDLAPETQP